MFKELFNEFAGEYQNTIFDIKIGNEVYFTYKNEVIQGIVTEIENGKHGRAVVMVMYPEKYNSKKDLSNPLLIHVSKLTKNKNNTKVVKTLQYT